MFAKFENLAILKSILDHMFDCGGKCMNDYKQLAIGTCAKELLKENKSVKVKFSNMFYQNVAKNFLTKAEEFNTIYIYIDESTYVDVLIREPNCFLTGFYVLPGSIKEKTFSNYRQTIYEKIAPGVEVKSFNCSDDLNRKALKLGQKYFDECSGRLFKLAFFVMSNKGGDKLNMVTKLENYIVPIYHHLMKEISMGDTSTQTPINVKIIIDDRNDLQDGTDFAVAAQYLMNIWKKKFKQQGYDFKLSLTTVDSKKSMGIQIADMFVGAYRKDLMYGSTSPKTKLLDFSFEKYDASVIPEEDDDFLKLFGLLQLVSIDKMKKANIKLQKTESPKVAITESSISSLLKEKMSGEEKEVVVENNSFNNIDQTNILKILIETIDLVKESNIQKARKQSINNMIFTRLCLDLKNDLPNGSQIKNISVIGPKAAGFKDNCEKVIENLSKISVVNENMNERLKLYFDQIISAILSN